VTRIRLPKSLPFEDYSGIAVRGNRIAVVSQVSSALWTATLAPSTWDITGEGTTLAFPRNERGQIIYGTIEGVPWISPDRLVVVSDKVKPAQPKRCRAKDQSIHISRSRPARKLTRAEGTTWAPRPPCC
jgi:hypothetical protein